MVSIDPYNYCDIYVRVHVFLINVFFLFRSFNTLHVYALVNVYMQVSAVRSHLMTSVFLMDVSQGIGYFFHQLHQRAQLASN